METNAMMRLTLAIAVASAIGALSIAGCAASPADSPDYLAEGDMPQQGKAGPAAPTEGETGPVVDEGAAPTEAAAAEPSAETPAAAGDGGADAGADADAKAPIPMTVTKSQTCTSTYGSHKSVSKMTWTVTATKLTIKSLTVLVTNSYGRNANDVDVWVRPPGGGETKAFNSGDILASGKLTTVPYRANTVVSANTKIRIETNFDQSGGDPSASCTVTIVR